MQQKSQEGQFVIEHQYDQISILNRKEQLKITVISFKSFQIYGSSIANDLDTKYKEKFKSKDEIYVHLKKFQGRPELWNLDQKFCLYLNDEPQDKLEFTTIKLENQEEINKILLIKVFLANTHLKKIESELTKAQTAQIAQKPNELIDCIPVLEKNIKNQSKQITAVEAKLELLQSQIDQNIQALKTKIQDQMQKNISQLEEKISNLNSKLEEYSEKIDELDYKYDHQVKDLNTKIGVARIQVTKEFMHQIQKTRQSIEELIQMIESYKFNEMKDQMKMISDAFEFEIRIKDYNLKIVQSEASKYKKLFIQNNSIKCLNDHKDYTKIVIGQVPFGKGKQSFRIKIKSIKNNGFIVGVCSQKVKDSLDKCSFYDQHLLCLSSCGYIMSRGQTLISNAKLLKDQIVKVIVDTYSGSILWIANDVQLAFAELGPLKQFSLFPFVGLGYFGDQIQIIQAEKMQQKTLKSELYAIELNRLNKVYR